MDSDIIRRKPSEQLAAVPVTNNQTQKPAQTDLDDDLDFRPASHAAHNLDIDDAPKHSHPTGDNNDDNGKKPAWYKRFGSFIRRNRRTVTIVTAFVLVLSGAGVSYALTRPAKVDNQQIIAQYKPKTVAPKVITSPLTGMEVSAEDSKRPVTGVMIENTVFARPQSGLKEAGVVYEAIAEAGITRFLALYQEGKPANLGPVRSARPYYVDWAHSFDAAYGHVGGSPDALSKIKSDGSIRDLDQFFNSDYYHRINSREAPHNMYTNMTDLDKAKTAKGWTSSKFDSWPRKKEAPAKAAAITAKTINLAISGPTYDAHYDYAPETNSYNRSEGGEPHMDAESKTQLSPKVVIALVIPYKLESDGYHSHYDITGTGNMTVFQDGVATKGTWKRTAEASQYEFSDEGGKPLKLDAGQTWITAVADPTAITFAP